MHTNRKENLGFHAANKPISTSDKTWHYIILFQCICCCAWAGLSMGHICLSDPIT